MRGDQSTQPCKKLEPKLFKNEEDKLAAQRFKKDSASIVQPLFENSKKLEEIDKPTLEPQHEAMIDQLLSWDLSHPDLQDEPKRSAKAPLPDEPNIYKEVEVGFLCDREARCGDETTFMMSML